MEDTPEFTPNIEREHNRMSVWVIDDDKTFTDALLMPTKFEDKGVDFIHYLEAEEALSDFEKACESQGQLPAVILMDFNLAMKVKDPKYRKGTEVIPELDRICKKNEIQRPEIVAFSTGKSENDELIAAGANWALNKIDIKEVRKYFNSLSA